MTNSITKKIKIYGERNTNTNYLSRLIKRNLDVDELPGMITGPLDRLFRVMPFQEFFRDSYFRRTTHENLGWKHMEVGADFVEHIRDDMYESLCFVTLTKNPYSWLLSLHKRPYHQLSKRKLSFRDFLQSEWSTVARDNSIRVFRNPIELWNVKNRSYFNLPDSKTLRFKTESLFEDPEKIINDISDTLGVRRLSGKFVNYESSTKDKSKNFDYYKDYYLAEKWRSSLHDDEIKLINESLDPDVMLFFGYNIISES